MTNVLKSKIAKAALGFVAAASMLVASSALAYTYSTMLKVGSTGADVTALQTQLGVTPATGYFGMKTQAAVKAYQTANGLDAVGYLGPKTRALLSAGTTGGTTSGTSMVPGCTAGAMFSSTTGAPCTSTTALVPGCTGTTGFSSTTGASCATGGTVVTTGGPLTVALASDNPAGGNYPVSTPAGNSSETVFAKFNFTAGSADVTVNQLTVTRGGLASDNNIQNLYLMNGASVITTSLGISNGRSTFSMPGGLFTVKAGTSMEVTLAGDVTGLTSSQNLHFGIAAAADVVTSTSVTPAGTFPMWGNDMYGIEVSNPSLATLTITPITTGSQVNAGTQAYTAGQFQFVAGNSAVQVKSIKFTQRGTINNTTDLANMKLMNGSVQVGATVPALNADGTVVFDLTAAPLQIASGQTVLLSLVTDVMGLSGASRNFQFTIQRTYDVVANDMTYNAGATVQETTSNSLCNGTTPTTGFPVCGVSVAVNSGTLTVTRNTTNTTVPTYLIAAGSNNQIIGAFDFRANGEAVRITSLTANLVRGTSAAESTDFNNLKLVDDQGVTIGSTYTSTSTADTTVSVPGTSSLNYIIPANTTRTIFLKADIAATPTGSQTYQATITAGTAQGFTSLSTITIPSSSGNTLSVSGTPFYAALNNGFGAITAVRGATAQKIGSFTLTAGAAEGVNVSSITLNTLVGSGISSSYDTGVLSNLRVCVTAATGSTTSGCPTGENMVGTSISLPNTTTGESDTFSSSQAIAIAAGGSVNFDVFADVSTGGALSGESWVSLSGAQSTGAVTNSSRTATDVGGTTITTSHMVAGQAVVLGGAGSLTAAVSPSPSNVVSSYVGMGITSVKIGSFKFTASNNENINLTQAVLTNTGSSTTGFLNVRLMNGTTMVGSAVPSFTAGVATFNLPPAGQTGAFLVPQNSSAILDIYADTNSNSAAPGNSGTTVALTLTSLKYTGAQSGIVSSATPGTTTGATITLYRSVLGVTNALTAVTPTTLSSANSLANFAFQATGNDDAYVNSMTVVQSGGALSTSPNNTTPVTYTATTDGVTALPIITTGSITPTAGSTGTQTITFTALTGGATITPITFTGSATLATDVSNLQAISWPSASATFPFTVTNIGSTGVLFTPAAAYGQYANVTIAVTGGSTNTVVNPGSTNGQFTLTGSTAKTIYFPSSNATLNLGGYDIAHGSTGNVYIKGNLSVLTTAATPQAFGLLLNNFAWSDANAGGIAPSATIVLPVSGPTFNF